MLKLKKKKKKKKSPAGQVLAVQPHPGLRGCDERTERFPAFSGAKNVG
jgi:hypothetical protein